MVFKTKKKSIHVGNFDYFRFQWLLHLYIFQIMVIININELTQMFRSKFYVRSMCKRIIKFVFSDLVFRRFENVVFQVEK